MNSQEPHYVLKSGEKSVNASAEFIVQLPTHQVEKIVEEPGICHETTFIEDGEAAPLEIAFDAEEFEVLEQFDGAHGKIVVDEFFGETLCVNVPTQLAEPEIISVTTKEVVNLVEDENFVVYEDRVLVVPYLAYNCFENPEFVASCAAYVNCVECANPPAGAALFLELGPCGGVRTSRPKVEVTIKSEAQE